MLDRANWERLQAIQEQMKDLHEEAKNLVRISGNRHEYERAKAYWLTYIENALEGPNFPLLPCTMGDTVTALEPYEDDDEDEETDESDSGEPNSGNSE